MNDSRAQLVAMARANMAYVRSDTIPQEPDVYRVPATNYYDRDRWEQEMELVFRRLPTWSTPHRRTAREPPANELAAGRTR